MRAPLAGVLSAALLALSPAANSAPAAPPPRQARASPAAPIQPIVEGVRWPDISLPVVVDLAGTETAWREPILQAMDVWNAAGSQLWFVAAPEAAAPNAVRFEGVDRLHLCGGQWQPVACTYPFVYQYAPQHLSHVNVQLNTARLPPEPALGGRPPVDLAALFTHELGHALGLGEATNPAAAMFPDALHRQLDAADRRELQALYGAAVGARPSAAPAPAQPLAGVTAPPSVSFHWAPVPGSTSYYLQLVDDAVFVAQGGIVDLGLGYYLLDTSTEQPTLTPPLPLAPGRAYWWRVKARTPGGNSPWSAPISFRVELP